MNRFAALLDRLAYEPGRNAKLRLLADYFRTTADPDRGYALAAITGALSFRYAKPGLIRTLIAERTDPTLFAMSYDYVGDLSETVALMWPTDLSSPGLSQPPPPSPPPLAGEGKGGGQLHGIDSLHEPPPPPPPPSGGGGGWGGPSHKKQRQNLRAKP